MRTAAARPLASPYLDPETIQRVVAIDDVLARNAAITRGYHALSEAGASILGREHVNWLTFGQWASAEARRSITTQAVPAPLRAFVGEAVSAAVAAGNAAVFGDVAPPFARFIRAVAMQPAAARDRDWAEGVSAHLAAHPQLAASEDLRRTFDAYLGAIVLANAAAPGSPDPANARERAARMLVANVSIGAHEQVVADPFVRAAIPGA